MTLFFFLHRIKSLILLLNVKKHAGIFQFMCCGYYLYTIIVIQFSFLLLPTDSFCLNIAIFCHLNSGVYHLPVPQVYSFFFGTEVYCLNSLIKTLTAVAFRCTLLERITLQIKVGIKVDSIHLRSHP